MRAYVTNGDGVDALRIVEREVSSPGRHEVLVRMSACALNYRDLLVINGEAGWKPAAIRVPVSDGAGVVMEVGANVTRFRIGDRVAGIFLPRWLDGDLTADNYVDALGGATADGVMTEARVFNEQTLVAVPGHLDNEQAATLPVAAVTAWHAVRLRSQVQRGETVVIQGTGGVSLFALRFVHALGGRAIVLSTSDAKLERVRELGAAETINTSRTPDWEDEVLARTHGRGADHIIEVIGGENLNRSLTAIRVSGTISFIGLLAGLEAPIQTYKFVTRNVRIHGIETGSRSMFEDMNRFINEHRIEPVIDKVFEFEQLPDAVRRLASRSHIGKIVVSVCGEQP